MAEGVNPRYVEAKTLSPSPREGATEFLAADGERALSPLPGLEGSGMEAAQPSVETLGYPLPPRWGYCSLPGRASGNSLPPRFGRGYSLEPRCKPGCSLPPRWRQRRHRLIPLTVLLLLFIPLLAAVRSACAEEPAASPLTGLVELRYLRCRSGAPIPIVWNFEWNEQAIAEGHLDYEIDDGGRLLGRFRLTDVVLSPGKNVFNAMLPALTVFRSSTPINIRARFISGTRTFELAEQSLRVPSQFVQWFNVGVASGATGAPSREESRLFERISLEQFLPPTDDRDRSTTVLLDIQTSALPTDPLTLCNFDVVVLLPAALVELRDDQAAALRKWVTAGGSLCVVAGGGLTPRHAALINELLAESAGHEAFIVDARGFLAPGEGDAVVVAANGADGKNGDVKAADALRVLRGEMR